MVERSIVHLNVIGFKAAVAVAKDKTLGLCLAGLSFLGYEPDLFEVETETVNRKLQEAIDKIQNRYGLGKISRGLVLAASLKLPSLPPKAMQGGKRFLPAGALEYKH